MKDPHWFSDPRVDSQAMMAAYVEHLERCEDAKAERLRTRWEKAHGLPSNPIRTMGCERRGPPVHKDCGDLECTTCNVDRRREAFRWASDEWVMSYEELRRPNSLDMTDVIRFLKTKQPDVN